MRKYIGLILVLLLTLSGCGKTQPAATTPVTEPVTQPTTEVATQPTAPAVEYHFATDKEEAIGVYLEVEKYGEADRIKDLAPREYWDTMQNKYGHPLSHFEDQFRKGWDSTETVNTYGLEYTYAFRIEKLEKKNKVALASIADHLNKDYGIDPATVTEAYELTVTLTEAGSGVVNSTQSRSGVIKIGEYWFAVDITTYSDTYVTATFKVPGGK